MQPNCGCVSNCLDHPVTGEANESTEALINFRSVKYGVTKYKSFSRSPMCVNSIVCIWITLSDQTDFFRHFQLLTAPACSPHVFQKVHHCPQKRLKLSKALTSTIMKCFEWSVKTFKPFITSSLPDSLDPLQFAHRPNRSTDDAIGLKNTYVRTVTIVQHSIPLCPPSSSWSSETGDSTLPWCDWILNLTSILHPDPEAPITIDGTQSAASGSSGVHISEDLTWTHHTDTITIYFLVLLLCTRDVLFVFLAVAAVL